MLTTLRIKNLALVSDLTLEMESGYNAVTGETGAGKSIVIGALKLVLGERADRSLIRTDCDNCSVEAVFDISDLHRKIGLFLEENGIEQCEGNQLILKRSIMANGVNRQFVNGSPTTVNILAQLGEWLVDFHGPHDHQSLLHPAQQLAILDAFGDLGKLRDKFVDILIRREMLEGKKAALIVDEKTFAQQLDLLRFQANEISAARLRPEEDAEVETEYKRASNASKLLELSQSALGILSENDDSLLTRLGALGRTLHELQRLDPTAACLGAQHEQSAQTLRELQGDLSHYAEKVEADPARLSELEERLNLIQSLKRKYGAALPDVIAFGEDAAHKLKMLENRDEELNRLNSELLKLGAQLRRVGQDLTEARKKIIPKLTKAVAKQLHDLGFKQSHFDIALTAVQPLPSGSDESTSNTTRFKSRVSTAGFDSVEFQFAPNPGETPHPLRAIASSGELARVMLALKTVLAVEDEIPVLIFDEVDANVGGETATAVGQKMLQIAKQRQVLCITHLPAVAACASAHYVVTKHIKDGRTVSQMTPLNGYERVSEIARMLGGQTEAARKHARELLEDHGQLE
jgi:DNA repair protein RecN (Recombination protein N)